MADSVSGRQPICDQSTFDLSSSIDDQPFLSPTTLATFTVDLYKPQVESVGELVDFLSITEQSQNNPSSGDPYIGLGQGFCNAIKSAFSVVKVPEDGIVQFWSPVQKGSKRVLTTDGQPFAFNHLDPSLEKYRLCTIKYQYNIDPDKLEVQEHSRILKGAPANAFLNRSGEVVLDRRVHLGSPLARSALECELMCYFVLPIWYPPQTCCVGVIEYCAKEFDSLLKFFDYWVYALQKAGLSTFHARECSSYKTLEGLKRDTDEIERALKIVCESHYLTLAQVSVAFDDKNHGPFSYSLQDTYKKRTIALKLIGHCFDLNNEDLLSFKDYYGLCDMLPLGIGEGLAGKALQSYEPHFCRNIYNVSNKELAALCPNTTIRKHSCFVICLSSETVDRDYVFEFLWLPNRNWCILLEALILTIKRCLPNFKFSSGAELGDELLVLDVGNSSERKINYLKIFEGKKLSPMPKIVEKDSRPVAEKSIAPLQAKYKTQKIELPPEDIKKHFGKTMQHAADDLKVCLATLKRKCKEGGIKEWQGPAAVKKLKNGEDNPESGGSLAVNEEMYLTFKAEYEPNIVKFCLPISRATFKAIEKEISKKLKLQLGSFNVKYRDEVQDLILLGSDQDISDCIKSSKNVNGTSIKLFVVRTM